MQNKTQFYMNLAVQMSKASYCERNKVGALLEKDGNIIAFGYNGTPVGFDNCCEYKVELPSKEEDSVFITEYRTKPEVLHAESNAIAKCAKSGIASLGATLYCTVSPCLECAKLIIQAGIAKVYYKEPYRDDSGIKLLHKALIPCYECK